MLRTGERFVEGFALGIWQANCYLLGDRERGGAVVVDPGQDGAAAVRERLDAHGVRCEAVLLTHGHLDHLWAAPQLAEELDVAVHLHPDDRWLYDDPAAAFGDVAPGALRDQIGLDWRPDPGRLSDLTDGGMLELAGFCIEVRHTPGHTPGSCVFLLSEAGERVLLSGDLLFAGSVGRTDLVGGSAGQQNASLARVVLPLADDTRVLPGHLEETTVGRERRANPWLRGL